MSYDLFHITQGAIIKNPAGAVLILQINNGSWILPGGHVDKGEDWEEALRREIKEELSVEHFEIKKLIDIKSWLSKDREHSIYALTFLIEIPDFETPQLSHEHMKHAWVTLETIDDYKFLDDIAKNRVRKGLEDRSFLF